jgi:hypothetical protein
LDVSVAEGGAEDTDADAERGAAVDEEDDEEPFFHENAGGAMDRFPNGLGADMLIDWCKSESTV